jgi:cytochrome c556
MEVIAWNFKSMVAMVKGNAPFDAATFAMRAENVAALTRNSMPLEGFIPNTHNGDTEAKAEIWKNWDDFKSKMSTLEKEAASLAEVAKTATQLKDVGPQFKKTGEACKGCHEKYKKD